MRASFGFNRPNCYFIRELSTGFNSIQNYFANHACLAYLPILRICNFFQAHVYSTESGDCAAFLSNYDSKSAARVLFNNMHYSLPPWSVSILPDCRNSVFNTAKVCKMSDTISSPLTRPFNMI